MIPISCSWCSNLNGPAIRWRVTFLAYNQQKWEEANNILINLKDSKPSYLVKMQKIKISTMEQLKLLKAVSTNLEETYFMVFNLLNCFRVQRGDMLKLISIQIAKWNKVKHYLNI